MQGESGVKFLSGQLNAIVRFSGCGKSEKGIARESGERSVERSLRDREAEASETLKTMKYDFR